MEGSMKNLFDPAGKVALVTGGTSGLGHAIAEAFLQNGVDVAVCSRHPESAPELAELAAAEGRRYLPVYCDITKEEAVLSMDTWRALTELDAKVKEVEDIKRQTK